MEQEPDGSEDISYMPKPGESISAKRFQAAQEATRRWVASLTRPDGSIDASKLFELDPRDRSVHSLTGTANSVFNRQREGGKRTKGLHLPSDTSNS
jgi:hypothetical protein